MIVLACEIRYDSAAHAHRVRLSRAARLRLARALDAHPDTRALGVSLTQADGGELLVAGVQAGVIRAAAGLCGIRVGGQG